MPRRRPKSEWAPVDAYEKSMAEIFEEPGVQEQIAMLGRMFDLQQQRGRGADREE
ncbi:MAG: hypothetical protein OXM56_03935 [Gammaproteobacteria bacterium]|nr:hypothetical protein [Gammaproteobacteria bacterium]